MQPTRKPQLLRRVHEVVQRVLELGEEEEALVRLVEEALLLKQRFEFRELRLRPRLLDRLGLDGKSSQLLDLFLHLLCAFPASVIASSIASSRSRSLSSISSSSSGSGRSGGA